MRMKWQLSISSMFSLLKFGIVTLKCAQCVFSFLLPILMKYGVKFY